MFAAVAGVVGRVAPYAARYAPTVIPVAKEVATKAAMVTAASGVAGALVAAITKGGKPAPEPTVPDEEVKFEAIKVGSKVARVVTPIIKATRAAARGTRRAVRTAWWILKAAARSVREDWFVITLLAASPIFTAINPWVGLFYAVGVFIYMFSNLITSLRAVRPDYLNVEIRVPKGNVDTVPEMPLPDDFKPRERRTDDPPRRVSEMTDEEVNIEFAQIPEAAMRTRAGLIGRQFAESYLKGKPVEDWDKITDAIYSGLRATGSINGKALIQFRAGFEAHRAFLLSALNEAEVAKEF